MLVGAQLSPRSRQPRSCSCHWGFSPSLVLASSWAGGGDFLGEAEVLGLGLPDPDWASMRACSFRTRSSSSFCERQSSQRSEITVPRGHRTCGAGVQGLGSGWAGVAQAPHLPSKKVSKGQAALVAVTQPGHVPVDGRESQSSQASPRPLPALPSPCAFMPSLPP